MNIEKKHIDYMGWSSLGALLLSALIGDNIFGKAVSIAAVVLFFATIILFIMHWRWYKDQLKRIWLPIAIVIVLIIISFIKKML